MLAFIWADCLVCKVPVSVINNPCATERYKHSRPARIG